MTAKKTKTRTRSTSRTRAQAKAKARVSGSRRAGNKKRRAGGSAPPVKKTPRTRKPEAMSLEAWQIALRREFGQAQDFKLKNVGEQPIFSQFRVTNPQSGGVYDVTIRGTEPGDNHCTCPDFAINTLGTCKHIEFSLAKLSRKRGGKKALREGFVPEASELYLRYDAQRDIVFRPGRACPRAVHQLTRKYFDDLGRLKSGAYAHFPKLLDAIQHNGHEVIFRDDVLNFAARVRDSASLRSRLDKALPQGAESAAFNRLLAVKLYPYQREGAFFAARAGRAILADDMGLGKTIQAIATAELLAQHGGVERVLVICPTSLKHQWKHEIEHFAPHRVQHTCVVEGPIAQREELYRQEAFFKIINYDVIHRDIDAIRAWEPDLVILDEAQRIKNWQTRAAKSVKQIESPHALVLTGTPLENRLEELYSIVEFVDRDRLGPMFRFLHKHQHLDENGRVIGYRNLDRISRTLQPILLRRTRGQVLKDLPKRIDKKLFVPMTEQQQRHHEENKEIVARIALKWRRFHFLSEADQRRLMIALQNMRMSCDSTYLLDQSSDHGVKADELCDVLEDVFAEGNNKVVIFSQWLRMHELIVNRLALRGWGHVLFHGGVPGPKRKDLIRRFKQDEDCRCFLSTDAGGVGLNLQHANVVINVDQPWNPAVLEQRIGRVHRLGQQRPVHVVHLIAQGAIEEGMLSLIDFKKSMFAGVLDGGQHEVFLGGTKLKRFMQTVETATEHISPPMTAEPPQDVGDNGQARTLAPSDAVARADRSAASGGPARPAIAAAAAGDDVAQAWTQLLSTAMNFLGQLSQPSDAAAARSNGDGDGGVRGGGNGAGGLEKLVSHDEKTGQPVLRIPLPDRQTLDQLGNALQTLARTMQPPSR